MKNIKLILIILVTLNPIIYCQSFDEQLIRTLHTERNQSLDGFMKIMSNSTYIILPTIPLSIFIDSRITDNNTKLYNSIETASSVILSGATTLLLKEIIKRPRPYKEHDFVEDMLNEKGYSLPSTHSSTAFSLATSLSLLYPEWYVIIPSYLWATIVSYSRTHLGVHYVTDILLGAVIGTIISFGTNYIHQRIWK